MANAVYPGSFDPITLGHCDIIRRIQKIFGRVTVLVSQSTQKKYLFTAEERKKLIEGALEGVPNVKVEIHEGLTVDYVKQNNIQVIVRGLRLVSDFEYESVMANMNKKLYPGVETMIVFASAEYYYVASTTVKEIAMHGGPIKDLVTPNVEAALKKKFTK